MSTEPTAQSRKELALHIVRTLQAAGHIAYFAGGCVRDELLDLHPKDYDVATDAAPPRIAALFPKTQEVGAAFGVVIVKDRRQMVEVATFRSDGPYSDRRRPDSVTFSDPRTDAQRRDFTINALFCDPFQPYVPNPALDLPGTASGALIDFVEGASDLAARRLRTVGDPDKRFAEDDLRVLRAIRFAARFQFAIEPATSAAIRRHAGALGGISRERVGEELRKMLAHPTRSHAARLLASHDLVGPTLGPVPSPCGDLLTAPTLANIQTSEFGLALSAWLLDLGLSVLTVDLFAPRSDFSAASQRRAEASLRRSLCLSNIESQQVLHALEGAAWLRDVWGGQPIARQKRAAQAAWFQPGITLLAASDPPAADAVQRRLSELAQTPGGVAPEPLLDGDQLIAAGFRPGPHFKRLIDDVYDNQLEGKITTRDEAMELARRLSV